MIIKTIENLNLTTENGEPISFEHYPYLKAIYEDMHPSQVILKSAQVGATLMMLIKAVILLKYSKRCQILYTMPDFETIKMVVNGKLDKVLNIAKIKPVIDNLLNKTFNNNTIIFKNAQDEGDVLSVSADVLMIDELDASKQDIIEQFSTRIQNSPIAWEWYFSHPSHPDYGIDIKWKQSDQHKWFIKCNKGHEQSLSYPENVDEVKKIYICSKCNIELTPENRLKGKWVATEKGAYRGYHINMMMNANKSCEDLLRFAPPHKTLAYFYNKVLGIPYVDKTNSVQAYDITKNCTYKEINGVYTEYDIAEYSEKITIAIDPNSDIRVLVGNEKGIIWIEEFPAVSKNDLDNGYNRCCEIIDYYINDFKKRKKTAKVKVIIDSGGDIVINRKLKETYPLITWFITYGPIGQDLDFIEWKDDKHHVNIDVNKGIDEVIANFKEERIMINGRADSDQVKELTKHFTSLYAEYKQIQDNGVKKKVWKTSARKDYVLCTLYYIIGRMRFG